MLKRQHGWLWCMGVLMLVAGSASAVSLTNPGFETGDKTGWGDDSFWRISSGASDVHSGVYGIVNDAAAGNGAYFVLHQELPSFAGQVWDVSVWMRGINIEAGKTESWLEVQFWQYSYPSSILQYQAAHLTADQNWTQYSLNDMVSPALANYISVRGVVFVASPPDNTDYHIFDDFFAEGSQIPEPTTLGLLGVAALGIALARRRVSSRLFQG